MCYSRAREGRGRAECVRVLATARATRSLPLSLSRPGHWPGLDRTERSASQKDSDVPPRRESARSPSLSLPSLPVLAPLARTLVLRPLPSILYIPVRERWAAARVAASLSCFFIHMRPAGARVLQRLIAIGCCCSRVPPPRSQGRNFRAPFWSPRARRYAREWVYRYTYCVCIYVCIYYSSSLVTAIFRGISVRADDSRTNRRLFFLGFLLSSRV